VTLEDVRARHVRTPLAATLGPWDQQSVALKTSDLTTLISIKAGLGSRTVKSSIAPFVGVSGVLKESHKTLLVCSLSVALRGVVSSI
jgi:hypothetical protein